MKKSAIRLLQKRVLAPLILVLLPGLTSACDLCNCYLGLDPGYNKNTIGIRYNMLYKKLDANDGTTIRTMHGGGSGGIFNSASVKQVFTGVELFARYYPVPKLQLTGFMPYQINTITSGDLRETKVSFSDLTLFANYQLINTNADDSSTVRHRILAGAGIKFPTGKSDGTSDINIPFAYDLVSGTGSTDYIGSIIYIGKIKKFGWNVELSYKYNGESSNEYKYGNTINSSLRFFYEIKAGKIIILPHIAGSYESGAEDEYHGEKQDVTKETIMWNSAGADVYFGKFSITTEIRIPVYQDLDESQPESRYWSFASFNYHF